MVERVDEMRGVENEAVMVNLVHYRGVNCQYRGMPWKTVDAVVVLDYIRVTSYKHNHLKQSARLSSY